MQILRRFTLAQKVLALNLSGVLLLVLGLLGFYQSTLNAYADQMAQSHVTLALNVAWDVLNAEGTDYKVDNGSLYAGATLLNARNDIVDRIGAVGGGVATIFAGDRRVATSIAKPDGERGTGTTLAPGPAYDALFKHGQSYRGTADILGKRYFTAYDPIHDAAGHVVGAVFVGQLVSDTHDGIAPIQFRAALTALALSLLAAAITLFLTRRLFAPLGRLREAMTAMSRGKIDVRPEGLTRGDDIGGMARAVETLRQSALEKHVLEAASRREREDAEGERNEQDARIARHAAEQAQVLDAFAAALGHVAVGDLTRDIDDTLPQSANRLREDFNAARIALKDTIEAVRRGADTLAHGAEDVATASRDLSTRSDNDAASIQQTGVSLRMLTSQVEATAHRAASAREKAVQAREEARLGGDIARGASDAMGEIAGSSREISEILSLINEIAFQTNLLALNAGVEAARAGEAGRGFAVVASEVRALSQRSGEASRQIATLVAASSANVANGVKKTQGTREALTRIIARADEVDRLIDEIAVGTGAQSASLNELTQAVSHLSESVERNAANATRSNAASAALFAEAGELSDLVGRFRLESAKGPSRLEQTPINRSHTRRL